MRIAQIVTPLVALLATVPVLQARTAEAQTVKATFNYPVGITGVAIDQYRDRVYVLLPGYNADGTNAVQVLQGSTSTVLDTVTVPVSGAIAVNVITGDIYIAGPEPSTTNPSGIESVVLAYDCHGNLLATVPVTANAGFGIVGLAVDPLRNKTFVSNATDNTLVEIDGRTATITQTLSLNGQTPAGIAVNIKSGYVYAALNDNQVAVFDENDSKLTFATYGSQTSGVAVDPFTNAVYVTDGVFDTPTVGVLNKTGATEGSVPVGLFPQGIDVDYVRNLGFAANEADGTMTEFNLKTLAVISTTTVAANSINVNSLSGTVYATGSSTLTVLTEK